MSSSRSEADKIETELAACCCLNLLPDPETDPYQWWKCRKANFSRLSSLAKKYLSAPAISAVSERVFVWEGGHYNMPQGMP